MNSSELKLFLDSKVKLYNRKAFIKDDPVCIPHQFSKQQDIEITGLFAAMFAWGQRVTIINKCRDLIGRMDNSPYEFVLSHTEADLKRLLNFKHRTFNDTDLLYFISFFNHWYSRHNSLEDAFANHLNKKDTSIEKALNGFRTTFFNFAEAPPRTFKHISSPAQNSACKRLNMYLRWMVRNDNKGVDFGIWNKIRPSQLMCPLDVHVHRVALRLGLIERTQGDWKTVVELTEKLRTFDPNDPVKYDFALFGLGVMEKSVE